MRPPASGTGAPGAGIPAAAPLPGPIERLARLLAVAGGLLMLASALLVTVSVAMRWATHDPIPGDFELVQVAVAIAVFAFMPFCQARHGNISVDTFTGRLSPRVRALIDAIWDLVYAAVMALIAWRLAAGAADVAASGTTTMVLQIVLWPGVAASALLAGVVALTALSTALRLIRPRA